MDFIKKLQSEKNGNRKFVPAEYKDRIMSLNRLEERNYERQLKHFRKENKTNILNIDRNMKTIAFELQEQQRQIERLKYEQSIYQINLDIDNLLKKRRTKSAKVSNNNSENTDNTDSMFKQPCLAPVIIRNQTAKYKSKTKQPIMARRASTAHPALRESNTNQLDNVININNDETKKLLNDESNDMLFVRVKRVKSSSSSNVSRRKPRPVTVSNSENSNCREKLKQNSMPSFQNDKDVLIKFNEIFNLI